MAGAPFPSPELGTPAPSTRTGFQSTDTYRARGERSSPSLGGKKEHFLLLGRGGNQAESLLLPSWRAKVGKDSQQPGQGLAVRSLQPHISWGQEDLRGDEDHLKDGYPEDDLLGEGLYLLIQQRAWWGFPEGFGVNGETL